MPHINLLPWREELRRRRQKEFAITAVVAVAAMGLVIAGVHLQFDSLIDFQEQRNKYLEQQITALDKKIKEIKDLEQEKQRLLARMEIIQQLQGSRPEVVHLVDELVTSLPEGVYYKKISQKSRSLTLEGVAQSNARVSSLMRSLDESDWLTDPVLVEIKATRQAAGAAGELRLSEFILKVTQSQPGKPAAEEAEGGKS